MKEYEDNKIYFSKWVDLFIDHTNRINKTFIEECLLAILKNNPKSIQWMIKPETISNQLTSFFEEASNRIIDLPTKHLRLFSTFIIRG